LREAHRCTRDDGWLLLATLGPGTLTELRQSFTKAGFPVPIPGFHSINVLHHELSSTNWNIDSYEDRRMRLEHFSVSALLHHLKGLGARHKRPASSETLRGKTWLQQLEYHYPRDLNNNIISSWEVVIIKAKKR